MLVLFLLSFFTIESIKFCNAQSCNNSNPCQLKGGLPLHRCTELVSENGFLHVHLRVQVAHFNFEWLTIPRRSYNGVKCPPTLRVKPGDILNITLTNNLELESSNQGISILDVTNLHTHGLHVSPLEPQDNVVDVAVRPGESYNYSYAIPDNHSPGTFWYHAHRHVSTTIQTVGGMAGMLIVDDDPNEMPMELNKVSCPENCEHDIPLVISPMLMMPIFFSKQTIKNDSLRLPKQLEEWLSLNVDNFTVNGEVKPMITIHKKQLKRFRLLHVGFLASLELRIVDDHLSTAPCQIREIARDGVYLDEPVKPHKKHLVLHAGNRLDWLIKCKEIGEFTILSEPREPPRLSFGGIHRKRRAIATIRVVEQEKPPTATEFPTTLPSRPSEYFSDLRYVQPDHYITVELSGNNGLNRDEYGGPSDIRFKVEVDSVVEIQLISTDYDYAHPMHFHVNHVQVIGFEPYTGPVAYYKLGNPNWEMRDQNGELCYYQHKRYSNGTAPVEYVKHDSPLKYAGHYERWKRNKKSLAYGFHQNGQWLDTVFSPGLSNITLRMRTDKFTGKMAIHCHLPSDVDDFGMMLLVEIVPKGSDLSGARILSGGAAPGSCKRCEWNRFTKMPDECFTRSRTSLNRNFRRKSRRSRRKSRFFR